MFASLFLRYWIHAREPLYSKSAVIADMDAVNEGTKYTILGYSDPFYMFCEL